MKDGDFLITDTSGMSVAELAEGTNRTFAGYFVPVQHAPLGFAARCRQLGMDVGQSVALRHRDGRLAGLTMLAIRSERGWCGGFGIVPEFRGRGLSRRLVEALIARARGAGLRTLQLEVITQNDPAIRTYARAGFQHVRDLLILSGSAGRDALGEAPGWEVAEVAPLDALCTGADLPQSVPCWQREPVTLLLTDHLTALIACRGGRVGAVLLSRRDPAGGPVCPLHLAFTDEAAARALLARACAGGEPPALFVLNEPEDSPALPLFQSLGLREQRRQHEMRITLG